MGIPELMYFFDMASLRQAQKEGRAGEWWVKWFFKKGLLLCLVSCLKSVVLLLKFVFLFLKFVFFNPVKFCWSWTGRKSTGLVRLFRFCFLVLFYFGILYALLATFVSSSRSTNTLKGVTTSYTEDVRE